jgi:hypothetical protein
MYKMVVEKILPSIINQPPFLRLSIGEFFPAENLGKIYRLYESFNDFIAFSSSQQFFFVIYNGG